MRPTGTECAWSGTCRFAITNRDAQRRALLANLDETKLPMLAQKTREAGVWSCVTLIVRDRMAALGQRDSLMKLPGVKYVAPEVVAEWAPTKDFRFKTTTAADFAAMREVLRFQMRMTRALRDSGARILMGTDTLNPFVTPGFSAHEELALLVAAGLTPYEALQAATASAAEFLRADIGVVASGKRADLILVERNPLKDLGAAARPKGVVLRGRWMPASELAVVLGKIAKLRASQSATAQ
jgi:imidazolonepropionase-like amidohydrolase